MSNSTLNPNCVVIEELLSDPFYQTVAWVQILIILATFVFMAILVRQCRDRTFAIHPNLKLLFVNLLFIYCFNSFFWGAYLIRAKFLFYGHTDACQLLTPVWLAFVFMCPSYIYLVAYSGLHFAVMAERARATWAVREYEREGQRHGWASVAIVWLVSVLFILWAVLAAFADSEAFSQPMGLITMTSKFNAQGIIYSYYVILFFLILTCIGDYWITAVNRRKIRNRGYQVGRYSLSRNYQVKENLVTMHLILPLDISYAILFSVYTIIGIILRLYRSEMPTVKFVTYYNSAVTLLLLHSVLTVLIYIQFIKYTTGGSKKRRTRLEPAIELGQVYFKQLEAQWK